MEDWVKDCEVQMDEEDVMFPLSFTETATFSHWRHVGHCQGLKSDLAIACFLLKWYRTGTQCSRLCELCQQPLSLTCIACYKESGEQTSQAISASEHTPQATSTSQFVSTNQQLPVEIAVKLERDEGSEGSQASPADSPQHSRVVQSSPGHDSPLGMTKHQAETASLLHSDTSLPRGDTLSLNTVTAQNQTCHPTLREAGDSELQTNNACDTKHYSADPLQSTALDKQQVQTQQEQGGDTHIPLPSLDFVKNESRLMSSGSQCESVDGEGDTHLPHSASSSSKRRWRKYELDTTVCWLCGKTLSTRKALVWHLFTCHNTKLPGTESLIAGRLLTDKKRGIKKRQHLPCDGELAVDTGGQENASGLKQNPTPAVDGHQLTNHHTASISKQRGKPGKCADTGRQGMNDLLGVKPSQESVQTARERISKGRIQGTQKRQKGGGSDRTNSKDSRQHSKKHLQQGQWEEEGRLCEKCGEAFDDRKELLKHRRACQQSTCHLCGKEVKFVKGHIRRCHRDLQRFSCPHCPKAFPTRWHLTHHMLLHSDERPYTCEVCGMGYRGKHHLTAHLRTHSGLRPYKCNQCQAAFTRSRGLKEHMRIHTGEKPYRCEVCGRQFASSGNFAAHRRKVHKINPLPCPSRKYVAMREMQSNSSSENLQGNGAVLNGFQDSTADCAGKV